MLQFLVTSKVRRRLLVLLWGEKKHGSVAELAELADCSFASSHSELKGMQRLRLVRSERVAGKEVFSANLDHPEAEFLSRLAMVDAAPRFVSSAGDEELKAKLVSLGAPLRGVKPFPVAPSEVLHVLVDGTQLARRDAVVARSMPLCFWNSRDLLDGRALQGLITSPEEKHAVAFFLELAGELGGDRRLAGLSEGLRDQRLTQLRPFFDSMTPSSARDFALARKWGFLMNMELDSFRALFEKFVTK
jgi:hypothetical protein